MKTTVFGLSDLGSETSVCLILKGHAARAADELSRKFDSIARDIALLNEPRLPRQ